MIMLKVILLVYFIVMATIGILSFFNIKGPSDYFVSGKSGNLWLISGSLFATIIGGSAILGTIELSQKAGWAAVWFLGSASFGMFVLAWIAPRISRLGHFTLPEMIRLFYGQRAEKTATLLIPVAWLGIISVQIIAGAKTLASLQMFSYDRAAVVCAAVYIFYTIIGGQKSILKTDLVQAVIILAGLILLFLLRIISLKGQPAIPPGTEPLLNEHFNLTDVLILVLTYSVTFVVGPDIYTRIFCARDEKTARKSALVVALLLLPVALLLTFLGISAGKGGLPPGTGNLILPGTSYLAPWGLGVLAVMMLSAIMSSAATTLMSSSSILTELVTDNLSHKKSVLITRIFIFLLGCISLWIALRETSILGTLLLSLSFFSGAFILPVVAGIAGWKVNREIAFAAMLSGGFVALAGKIIQEIYGHGWGYGLIIAAFLLNGTLLLFPFRRISKKHSGQVTGNR